MHETSLTERWSLLDDESGTSERKSKSKQEETSASLPALMELDVRRNEFTSLDRERRRGADKRFEIASGAQILVLLCRWKREAGPGH
jgi:hypothetical protein